LGCLFSLPVSGIKTFQLLDVQANANNWLSGGSFGAEGSFFLLPVLAALIWFLWQAPDHPQALLDLELAHSEPASAPPILAAADAATSPASPAMEDEPERENRFRTKFGTSEGFDSEMLRELRELQRERETAEIHAQQERATNQKVEETEQLKSPVTEQAAEQPAIVEVIEIAKTPEPVAEEPMIQEELAAQTIVETPVAVIPVAATPPRQSVAVATEDAEAGAPEQIASEPARTPTPAPKKPRPKW